MTGQRPAGAAALEIGSWRVETMIDGRFALDGGSMFGVVPRVLWQRSNAPDERNRIPLASRLLLLRGHDRVVLVDTGLGERWSDKERDIYAIRSEDGGVAGALAARGLQPDDVTDVILTHLHFDHAAGTVVGEGVRARLRFANARHYLQRRHWDWAWSPTRKDTASFRRADFEALRDHPRLELLEGPAEALPGVRLLPLHGHTRAMQAVQVTGGGETLLYAADLVPTATHLRLPFIMAYDNEPLVTLQEKERLLGRAAREGWILVLEHDPETAAVRLGSADGVPSAVERLEI